MAVLSRLLAGLLLAGAAQSLAVPRHATLVDRDTVGANYTFIIAGGGIAGLTLADRLTENPNGTSPTNISLANSRL